MFRLHLHKLRTQLFHFFLSLKNLIPQVILRIIGGQAFCCINVRLDGLLGLVDLEQQHVHLAVSLSIVSKMTLKRYLSHLHLIAPSDASLRGRRSI
jgi:hypothetical protein